MSSPLKHRTDGPTDVWYLDPTGWAYTNSCSVTFRVNGAEVTGAGDVGGEHVDGKGVDFIRIAPHPTRFTTITADISCPDGCSNHFQDTIGRGVRPHTNIVAKVLIIPFGGAVILAAIGGWNLDVALGLAVRLSFSLVQDPKLFEALKEWLKASGELIDDIGKLISGWWELIWN